MMSGSRKSEAVWKPLRMPGYQGLPGKTVAGFEGLLTISPQTGPVRSLNSLGDKPETVCLVDYLLPVWL